MGTVKSSFAPRVRRGLLQGLFDDDRKAQEWVAAVESYVTAWLNESDDRVPGITHRIVARLEKINSRDARTTREDRRVAKSVLLNGTSTAVGRDLHQAAEGRDEETTP